MILGYVVLFIFAWALISIFYGDGLAPCLRDRGRFQLYALRDELRELAIHCQAEPDSFAFRHLERMLNRMTRMCDWYSASNLLYVLLMARVDSDTLQEHKRFDAEATSQLKQIERRAMDSMVRVMFINSPLFVMFAGSIILTSEACKRSIELKNRLMWHDYHDYPSLPSWPSAIAR